MKFLASQVAAAVDGELFGDDILLDGATQDSRSVTPGCLFVPLRAERDGHEFIGEALDAGAIAFLTSNGLDVGRATGVRVPDTAAALLALGATARRSISMPVVGITGSVGKTSTKDMTVAVLAPGGPAHSSPRSFNNEIGVPLTLVNAPDEPATLVLELGARQEGDIALLCGMARPDVGVITTVAAVHTGAMGSVDAVARTKGELLDGLPSDGCAVLAADVPAVMAQASRSRARQLTFGAAGEVRASGISINERLHASFLLESPWGRTEVHLWVPGVHMVDNALAAAAVGLVLGVPLEEVAVGLGKARLSPGRMQITTATSGLLVVNDAYNANPTSVRAALRAVALLPGRGRRLAVLGLMAELGGESSEAHLQVVALAHELGVEVLAVDTEFYGIEPLHGVDEALDVITSLNLGEGDSVLVKGSLVVGLQELAEKLVAT